MTKLYQYFGDNPPIEITDPEFTGTISIGGTVSIGDTVSIAGTTTFNNYVSIGDTVSIAGTTTFNNYVSIGGTVSIAGTTTFVSNVSVGGTLSVVTIQDSNNSIGSTGAFLRSDGKKTFWDNTPINILLPTGPLGAAGIGTTTVSYYNGAIVRGYTMGGYQNSVAYKNVYRTYHSTDTTTDLGAILSFFVAYTDGASSGRYGYAFDGHSSSAYNTAGKDINKFDMITDSNISFATQMNANKATNTNVAKYKFIRAYVFGDTDPEKFEFSTETPTVASTSWTDRNSLQWRQRAYGDDIAYFKTTTTGYQLTFATETWGSWTPGGAFGNGVWGCISTYSGYMYWKNSATNWQKYNVANTAAVILNVTTPSQQEENYHTGESKGYMVGMYNGDWQLTGGILDYINDSFKNVTSVNAPAINSSAACTEFGRFPV
jgi:hypothetical protein